MIKESRISIIGGPGTGKTTLAENIGKKLNYPVYHLDTFEHLENWKKRNKNERDKIILEKIEENKWVIDGTYKSSIEKRFEKTDLIIFLNYSTFAKIKGILSRYIKNRGKEKPEIPGCNEKMDFKFIKYTAKWNTKTKKIIEKVLEKNKDKKILVFKNRKSLNKWYEEEFNEKINVEILKNA